MIASVASGLIGIGSQLIDRMFPDAEEADKRKAELALMAQQGDLKELEISMSAIITEANSKDPFTSRARPCFMYVIYLVIITLVLVFPVLGIWFPDHMGTFYENVAKGFEAIPEAMWWTFTSGYLGYTGARTFEKNKGVTK